MPSNIVKSFAKKTGKSEKEVERLWNKAKKIVSNEYNVKEGNDKFYALVTGVLKKELGLKESFEDVLDAELIALYEIDSNLNK